MAVGAAVTKLLHTLQSHRFPRHGVGVNRRAATQQQTSVSVTVCRFGVGPDTWTAAFFSPLATYIATAHNLNSPQSTRAAHATFTFTHFSDLYMCNTPNLSYRTGPHALVASSLPDSAEPTYLVLSRHCFGEK